MKLVVENCIVIFVTSLSENLIQWFIHMFLVFAFLIWIISEGSAGGGVSQREFVKLKKQNQSLQEENNLLKLKMEILLDMVSESRTK